MLIQGIDYSKCNNCSRCVKVCPSQLYTKTDDEKKQFIFDDPHKICIRCGHCIAICPVEAILFEDEDPAFNFDGTKKLPDIVSYDDLLKIIRMRRSIRVYKNEPVPEEKLDKILEAMRYAPTASNRQNWRLTIVTKKEEIEYLSRETTKVFKLAKKVMPLKYLAAPFLSPSIRRRALDPKSEVQLDMQLDRMEKGEDIVFFDAPCVIILYSRDYTNDMAANDAGIVFTHGMLAAQALGLGTCWVGFAQRTLQNKRKIRKRFHVPKGFHVFGVLTIGTPAYNFQRGPPRRALRITRMD